MIITQRSHSFRKTFFPETPPEVWSDWRWQLRNRIRDLSGLERVFHLSEDERKAVSRNEGRLPLGLTPYYASLMDPQDADDPLRRTKIPTMAEFTHAPGELRDPLGEEDHSPVPGLVHTYPDKVLFLVTDFCATYCRYCTRARMVGAGEYLPDRGIWEKALDYIAQHKEIRDVLLSGGDPLILSEDRLEWLLSRLRQIPHVEILRIGTKVPAVLPQRVTHALTEMLRKYHPLYMSIHFVHPRELTDEVGEACGLLADAGIPLGGQMVLLKGINDDTTTMRALVRGQLRIRVKPYYLHQCDAILGSSHFRTQVKRGVELIRDLHGHTTGYAVPQYMIDAPGGGGKVPISPDYIVGRKDDDLLLRNYRGQVYRYRDDGGQQAAKQIHDISRTIS